MIGDERAWKKSVYISQPPSAESVPIDMEENEEGVTEYSFSLEVCLKN